MMKKLILIMLLPALLQAAGPLMHLYLADEFLRHFPRDEESFFVGTSFPDIRYFAKIDRELTHFDHVELDEIINESSNFKAGMLFHSFVDVKREEFVLNYGAYSLIEELGGANKSLLLKQIEEEILFNRIDSSNYIPFLDHISSEQKLVSNDQHLEWNRKIQHYLASNRAAPLASPPENWKEAIPRLAKTPYYTTYFDNLLEHISSFYDAQ